MHAHAHNEDRKAIPQEITHIPCKKKNRHYKQEKCNYSHNFENLTHFPASIICFFSMHVCILHFDLCFSWISTLARARIFLLSVSLHSVSYCQETEKGNAKEK